MSTTRRRSARGQTLALFAVLLPGLIGAMALGVDGANLWLRHRDAQSAADLAALAGARLLPLSPTATDQAAARAAALANANANGYSSGVTVTTPYVDSGGVSHMDHVKVDIARTVSHFFLPVLGVSTSPVNVRAVAYSLWTPTVGGTMPAIFAGCDSGGSSCPDQAKALDWSGSDGTVFGGTVSNCGILVGGSNNDFGGGTDYRTGCAFSNGGSGNVYTPAATADVRQTWPLIVNRTDFNPCTVTVSGKIEMKNYYQSGKLLKSGVYCATGSSAEIILDESNVTGTVTLVSEGTITISGQFYNLTAFHPSKVVLWANSPNLAIKLSGSNGTFTGIVYAKRGQVEVSGSGISTTGGGSILADRVKIAGQFFYIDSAGLGGLGAPVLDKLQLVE
jgi:Flp pilus assembly protein TadG